MIVKNIQEQKKVDIIWNITRLCNWDCAICCVDAIHIKSMKKALKYNSHKSVSILEQDKVTNRSVYNQALVELQNRKEELTLQEKLMVLKNMKGYIPKIDFSGGDPLLINDTLEVIKHAHQMFGKENITLTATGIANSQNFIENYAPLIGEFNFTFDSLNEHQYEHRPSQYTSVNLNFTKELVRKGVKVRAESPLTKKNIKESNIKDIYHSLHNAEIPTLLLMRLFPVGRGSKLLEDIPSEYEYRKSIELFREEEAKYGYPKIKLQCALKYLDNVDFTENPCDMGIKSFGLMPNGDLIVSPWGYGYGGKVFDDNLLLGNLVHNTLEEILQSDKAQYYRKNSDLNFGHCKIHAYLNSDPHKGIDRYFGKTDPLYSKALQKQQYSLVGED